MREDQKEKYKKWKELVNMTWKMDKLFVPLENKES